MVAPLLAVRSRLSSSGRHPGLEPIDGQLGNVLLRRGQDRLSWTVNQSIEDLPSSSVGYSVFVNGTLATDHRDASLRHLSPGTTYTLKVTARDGSGNVAESNIVSVTTLPSSDAVPDGPHQPEDRL